KSTGNRQAILLSICSGMVDKVYTLAGMFATSLDKTDRRQLDKHSVVSAEYGSFVVGIPFDIGRNHLLTMNTVVTLEQLTAVAAGLLVVE
ncbi:hypothetical protein ABTM58_19940, partial [Acinetobacter baumannii]